MKVWGWSLLPLTLLLGCSDLGSGDDGIVALEIRLPNPAVVQLDDTVQLSARALNLAGDSVAADIIWLTPDTGSVAVDSSGRLTAKLATGTGRVQARTGSLRSNLETFTIQRRSDSVALTLPADLTVFPEDSATVPLVATLLSLTPDTAGITGSTLLYEVVDSAALRGIVRFAGGVLSLRATTSTTGAPAVGVTLRRVPGATFPATATVRVSATRPSGAVVPGSGQTFSITLQ